MIDILLESKKQRDDLINFLMKQGVETRIFYPPIHNLEPYRLRDKKFKNTIEFSNRGLWLPSSVTLKKNEVKFISKLIIDFFMN